MQAVFFFLFVRLFVFLFYLLKVCCGHQNKYSTPLLSKQLSLTCLVFDVHV